MPHAQLVRRLAALSLLPVLCLPGCGFKIEPDPEFYSDGQEAAMPDVGRESEPEAGTAARPVAVATPGGVDRNTAIERLLTMATSPTAQVRANAIEGLERAGPRAEAVVALALRDENPGVRSVAAAVAGRAGLSALTPTIRTMTGDASPFVRASVIGALHALSEPVDPSELADLLMESPDPRLRAHAAFVLGEMGEESALPMLKQAWTSTVRDASEIQRRILRLQIAEALIKLGNEESLDAVRAALYPARPEELEATALAVQIIGQVRDRGSIDQLIYLSEAEGDRRMPAEVRLAVAGALARMGLTEGGFIADEYLNSRIEVVRAQTARVYGRTGRPEHLDKLAVLTGDESELVRVAAAAGTLDLLTGGAQADAQAP